MTETDIDQEDYDAHETAKPGEPTFTIQGGDLIGPPAVQHWAELARSEARGILNGSYSDFEPTPDQPEYTPTARDMIRADKLLRKATSAEGVVWEMQAYQRGEQEQAGVRARYDTELPDITVAELDARKVRITIVNQLGNAQAIAHDAADKLASLQLMPESEVRLREALELIKLAHQEIDPRKGNERS